MSTLRTDLRRAESCFGKIALALTTLALAGSTEAAQVRNETTTLYVARYFEVRDHDQPTKYVFNGSTRVAAIIGSLSPNLRVQRLRLCPGWNLCSLAVSGPFPATAAEAIGAAYRWNAATGDYAQVTLGQTFAAGSVLWLKANTESSVSVLGAYSDPVPQLLQPGGAYSPGAGLEVWSPMLPDSASSWVFDAASGQWLGDLAGDLATASGSPPILGPGEAFYLQAAGPVSLDAPDPTLRTRYYQEDHLGSTSVVTDASGALVEETAFYGFGRPRNEYEPRESGDPYQFTQKEHDVESGLNYFDARYLAPGLARFLSVDPLGGGDGRNAYNYGADNPVKYVDPAGLDPTWKVEGEATHSGGLLGGENTLELSGSLSDESTTTTEWIVPTVKYKNQIRVGGGLECDSITAMDLILGHSPGFRGNGHGQFSYSPDAPDPNWMLNVPFDVSVRGGVGINGLSYSGTASAQYKLGRIPLGKVSMSFHGDNASVPEYSWRQYGWIGFYPKIDAGVLPVPPPEQAFNATKMEWGQGIGPTARYVRQWPTSRLELVSGFGVGLDAHNIPSFTGVFGRLSYSWGQPRSWGRMTSELSENAGLPQ